MQNTPSVHRSKNARDVIDGQEQYYDIQQIEEVTKEEKIEPSMEQVEAEEEIELKLEKKFSSKNKNDEILGSSNSLFESIKQREA